MTRIFAAWYENIIDGTLIVHLVATLWRQMLGYGEDELVGDVTGIPPEGSLLPDTYRFSKGMERRELLERMQNEMQRDILDSLGRLNEAHRQTRSDNSNLSARMASYELAFKMQTHAPEAVDLSKEKNFFETRVIEYQTGGTLDW